MSNNTNVQVLVRCRIKLPHEQDSESNLLECDDNAVRVQHNACTDKVFTFDKVLDGSAQQEDVFEYTSPLIDHALDGLHATIFAYGQTGAGKTYTMEGFDYQGGGTTEQQGRLRPVLSTAKHKHGVIPRAIEAIFDRAHKRMAHNPRVQYKIKCSYFQIYNEKITDLLNMAWKKDKTEKGGLRIRWNKNNTFYVENLFIFECDSASQARELFATGVKNKAMGSHQMNLQSSRSHAIYTLYVESWDPQAPECVIKSELTLVDLAGSEKLTLMSKNPSQKLLQESIEINASLLALGKVISALGAGTKQHIPYRDAKLTKLLKHALGGNSLTLMIACINPCDAYVEETVSTLFYAGRARNIRNDPRVNEDSKTALIKALRAEITSLKMELSHFRTLAMNNGVAAGSMEARPHTAGEVDQSREVVFLGEKLVDSVKMLKDIIIVNGQLREAYDEVSNNKQEAESNLGNLNEENVLLRERIEMLESIVMQEADEEPQPKVKVHKAGASPAERTPPQAPAPVPREQPKRSAVGKKALEKYRSRYKQHKMPSYDDYYSVAATKKRTSRSEPKRQSYTQPRAFEGLKVSQQQPLFTRRADLAGSSLQTAAAIALGFSQKPRSSVPFSTANGTNGSPAAYETSKEIQQALAAGDMELESRRKARAQRAALLEVQHRQLQQRHVTGNGASSFTSVSYGSPLMPQMPQMPQMPPMGASVRQMPLSATKTRRSTEIENTHEYLTAEEAQSYFSPEQLAIINKRRLLERTT
eukprot:TRINITY_DN6335_c0_g1_i1.p1 TRINITY_DN6335_c0_g1~~TRINITY_DN6335_c0_g1_i1.p1  ORF type:complete len:758 (+),score=216.30 TRINITY_DN6335_c0_g1_i1:239-2512(+)